MEQRRILHVLNELNMGGIQAFLMNVYRNIDKDQFQFDFLIDDKPKGFFEDEILSLGGKIYRVTPRKKSIYKNKKDLNEFFKKHKEYECIHFHCSNLSYIEPLIAAKKNNVPVRIMHSHSTNLPNNIVHKVLHKMHKQKLKLIVTDFLACSDLAGKWLYEGVIKPEEIILIKNGIKTDDYIYNQELHNIYRKKLNIESNVVFGNVGRFCEAKNHMFLLETFNRIKDRIPEAVLLLVGDGELNEQVSKKINELKLQDKVQMLGARSDVPDILQALDCIVMPSKWEGFPVALLEEQAAGLPCFVSDTVTTQAKINSNVYYLPLKDGADKWADFICNHYNQQNRITNADVIKNKGFDISNTVERLEEIYSKSNKHDN